MSKTIGETIRTVRMRLRLSQEEAASRAQMSPPANNRLELGHGDPRWSTIVRVARGLGLTVGELAAGTTDRVVQLLPPVPTADLRSELRAVKRDLAAASARVEDLEQRLGRPAARKKARSKAT